MSLKALHIIFIVACIALALFVGVWSVASPAASGSPGYLAMGVFFFLTAAVLVIYLVFFIRKFRGFGAL